MSNQHPTIEQVATMMDGQVISGISGTLTRLYERRSGTNANGNWSIQNGELSDPAGNKIAVMFKDRDEVPQTMKGSLVTFESNQTQNGIHGVKVFDDTYKQTTTRKLKVTSSATCKCTKPGPPENQVQQQPQATHPQPQQTNQAGLQDPPFENQAPPQQPTQPAPQQPQQPQAAKPAPQMPAGVKVTGITYREVRQKAQYEPITAEIHMEIEPGAKLSAAWKYAEAAADAMLKHSTGR